jgi:hypothetical protein
MHRERFFSRINLGVLAVTVAFIAAFWAVAPAHAEPKQDDAAHQQLCADLYLIYDTNMDIYYDQSNSPAVRQKAYESAHEALSDYRKQGCKGGAVSRAQEVLPSVGPIVNIHGASSAALPGRAGAATTATGATQLLVAE